MLPDVAKATHKISLEIGVWSGPRGLTLKLDPYNAAPIEAGFLKAASAGHFERL